MNFVSNMRARGAALALAGVIATSAAIAVPVVTAPAPAHAIDSLESLCAGLYQPSKGKNQPQQYKDCIVTLAKSKTPSKAELACYKGAGIGIAKYLVKGKLSKGNARQVAIQVVKAGAWGCVKGLINA